MMKSKDEVIAEIRRAFAPNEYPGGWCLKRSTEGNEPYLLEKEFKGKTQWADLDAAFIDQAPNGFASALSFFSDEAFRFYLPAYLIADLDGKLGSAQPVFHLTHGLDEASRSDLINPRRYGGRTWYHEISGRFAMFTREEVNAIVAYLEFKRGVEDDPTPTQKGIDDALKNYWKVRASEAPPRASLHG
jgi:hypothetical protein